jgi:hypothetical protein
MDDKAGLENKFHEFTSFLYHASINPEIIYQRATKIYEEARLFRKQIRDIAE